MNQTFVVKNFGATIDLGPCLVGQNLNVASVRGYAKLHFLALISDADVYDMVTNPTGTQRDIKAKHARECLEYARAALSESGETHARFFPEIILNVRDLDVVQIYDVDDPKKLVSFSSFSDPDDVPRVVGVRVKLDKYLWPKSHTKPLVSRVDGNHRLWSTDDVLQELSEENATVDNDAFAMLPFALLVGLKALDEARLFRDINDEHQGMETAHLDTLEYRITDPETMKADPEMRPNWIAHELATEGRAFHNVVFLGGAKAGVKEKLGWVPPVKVNALGSAIKEQLRSSTTVKAAYADSPDMLLLILNNYWTAVADTFPEEWANKKEFILLQTIGLGGFARLGGHLIDRAFNDETLTVDGFKAFLAPIKQKVSLHRDAYKGIAGAGGQVVVADKLLAACEELHVKAERAKQQLGATGSLGSAVAKAAEGNK